MLPVDREGASVHGPESDSCETTPRDVADYDSALDLDGQASSAAGAALLGLLGVVLQDTNLLIGLDCSPLTVVGVGSGNACSANVVCCENNNIVSTRLYT